MHVFSHQFPMTWEKTTKPIEWGKPKKFVLVNILQNPLYLEYLGNWYSYFSHSMGAFSIRFPSYGIPHHICMSFLIKFSIALENSVKPIEWGRPGKLIPILFQ